MAIGILVRAGYLRHRRRVLRLNRLLHEERIVRLKTMRVANRHLRRNPTVHIQQNVHVIADRFAHRSQAGLRFVQYARPVQHVRYRHRDRFHGVPAFSRLGLRALRHRIRCVAAEVRVHPHTVPHLSAQKLVDRLARFLAFDVPQCLVDARESGTGR